MAFDLWTHQFCLSCDKQTDGATYCSEGCRLADYEKTSLSTPASASSSPGISPLAAQQPGRFLLSPAYDFGTVQPYGRTPHPQQQQPARNNTTGDYFSQPGQGQGSAFGYDHDVEGQRRY